MTSSGETIQSASGCVNGPVTGDAVEDHGELSMDHASASPIGINECFASHYGKTVYRQNQEKKIESNSSRSFFI